MKRFLIFFVIIAVFGFDARTQNKNKPCLAIENGWDDMFYAGITSSVRVITPVAPEKLLIDWGGATAKYLDIGIYDVYVPDSLIGKEITITVSAEIEKGKMEDLGSRVFRIRKVPDPEVYVGANILTGYHSKRAILKNPLITARMGYDFNTELRWVILSYNVTFIKNGIMEQPIFVKGARFSDDVINKIENAPSGTIIAFSDFKIQSILGYFDIEKKIIIRIKDDD